MSESGHLLHIQIIVGSVREGRRSLPIAEWALAQARQRTSLSVELVDLKTWDLPMFALPTPPARGPYRDPLQLRWAANVAEANGYVFVCPEYNHGYPAALKNALDYLYAEWARKPAAFISYGNVGGARSVEQLRLVLLELQMTPLPSALHLFGLREKLKGEVFAGDEDDAIHLGRLLDDLSWWAATLGAARGTSS